MRNFIVAAALVFLCQVSSLAENQTRIFYVKGRPNIMKEGLPNWKACEVDMSVDNGDRVKTENGEEVEVSFMEDESNIVRIEENTDVYIRKCSAPYRIELLNGAAMALIKKLPDGSTFEIATPAGLSGARGTGWRSLTSGATADFQCYENLIYVRGMDQGGNMIEGELTVKSGWEAFLRKFEKPERIGKLSYDDIARWNQWKSDLAERLKQMQKRLDRAGNLQGKIDQLESQKLDVKESRDIERSGQQQESKAESGGDSYDLPR